jgi:hypothetical protein
VTHINRTPTLAEIKTEVIENCIYIVQQSLDSVRAEDDGESRSTKTSIAAREHVIRLLTGYRDQVAARKEARRPALDVERLHEAMRRFYGHDMPLAYPTGIAAEYAALDAAQENAV